jgi:putative ABC transport system permease protein
MSTLEESREGEWLSMNFYTYVALNEGTDPMEFEAKFQEKIRPHVGGEIQRYMGITYEDFEQQGNRLSFSLFPLTNIHLHSHKADELAPNSDVKYIYIFSAIGLFILILACINFMNLSTARSANRAREVGLRKVVGAGRRQLILQFLSESVVLSAIALLLAAGAVLLLLPHFNTLSGKNLNLLQVNQPWLWFSMLILIFGVGVLAGSYPAFFLSAFRPIQTLKGGLSSGAKNSLFRNMLVVFQFSVTIILIIGSLVVYDQLRYIQNKKLGFDKDHLIILKDAYALGDNLLPFKEEMKRRPEVVNATISSFLPTPSARNFSVTVLGRNPQTNNNRAIYQFSVDFDYIQTLGMEIIEGRAFDPDFATDSSAVVINEATAKIFGIADDPIGKELGVFTGPADGLTVVKIIGVVKDFHFDSLREKIGPLAMFIRNSRSNIVMRINTRDMSQLLATLESEWQRFAPGQPFSFEFLDEAFARVYETEMRIGAIVRLFTFLAIFVACLGLLGLATYVIEQRTKEIGIRKVLGASVANIYVLLTSQFVKWVILANVLALPAGYLIMLRWLEGFEYRAGISWSTVVLAAASGAVIAILTVSFHAFRATRLNPVESLKHE